MESSDKSLYFSQIQDAPADPIYAIVSAYEADQSPKKVDLGVGAYRDEQARPWILPSVRKAEELLYNDSSRDHEYLPIAGLSSFVNASQALILGPDSSAIKEDRVCSFQALSGTGSLHLGAGLLAQSSTTSGHSPTIYISDPSWPIHRQVFTNVGLHVKTYSYFEHSTRSLDLDGILSTIATAPSGSTFVLHACAHNPTGTDPTQEQWRIIAEAMRRYKHFPFFDCAYQGFASGSLDEDVFAIRYFIEQGFEMLIAQSFAKNMGLYGERPGAMHYVAAPGARAMDLTRKIHSQLSVLQRSDISSPPAYGAQIASIILNTPDLFSQWKEDLLTMSDRIKKMRKALRNEHERLKTPGSWDHITRQIGMFSFTGLNREQVLRLREEWHCYMAENGRISVAGLNEENVEYFAKAVDDVVRKVGVEK
ncbi:Aspartate aminotransferase, cytoplasmic [Pseudocercospora fuligena]|uniref:aspartate transaminase n=1 Tax=Pseudocercospora fuligena TaxID=685502 RepID=A0A8H6R8U2_9PEZI|nr:Aspartate aminotransferase, cytoplasmic [Pseudocercospora fuligena]